MSENKDVKYLLFSVSWCQGIPLLQQPPLQKKKDHKSF